MKVLILTRFVKEYEPRRLAEEIRKAGDVVDLVKYGQISLGVVRGRAKIQMPIENDLDSYDVVIPRAASKKGSSMVAVKTMVLHMFGLLGKTKSLKVLNGKSFEQYPLLGKMEQGMLMAAAGLPTVDFVTFGSKVGWRKFRENPRFDFPLIVKGRFGSHGRQVRLVKNWDEFEKVFGQYREGVVMVQPKLKVKQWYRCIVMGGRYLGEMRHRQKDKYGGEKGILVKLNSTKMNRLKEICLKASSLFSCDYAGIDVAWDEEADDFKILEVNRTAQFKYFERRTGVNVAAEIVGWLCGRV